MIIGGNFFWIKQLKMRGCLYALSMLVIMSHSVILRPVLNCVTPWLYKAIFGVPFSSAVNACETYSNPFSWHFLIIFKTFALSCRAGIKDILNYLKIKEMGKTTSFTDIFWLCCKILRKQNKRKFLILKQFRVKLQHENFGH